MEWVWIPSSFTFIINLPSSFSFWWPIDNNFSFHRVFFFMSLSLGTQGNSWAICGSKKEKAHITLNLIFRKFTAFLMDKELCLLGTLECFMQYRTECFTSHSRCVSAASGIKNRPHSSNLSFKGGFWLTNFPSRRVFPACENIMMFATWQLEAAICSTFLMSGQSSFLPLGGGAVQKHCPLIN